MVMFRGESSIYTFTSLKATHEKLSATFEADSASPAKVQRTLGYIAARLEGLAQEPDFQTQIAVDGERTIIMLSDQGVSEERRKALAESLLLSAEFFTEYGSLTPEAERFMQILAELGIDLSSSND